MKQTDLAHKGAERHVKTKRRAAFLAEMAKVTTEPSYRNDWFEKAEQITLMPALAGGEPGIGE